MSPISSLSGAISSIQWPLMPSMPMYYEPLSSLQTLRQPASIPSSVQSILQQGITESLTKLANVPSDKDENTRQHLSSIALALVFLGNGLPDEAHDLITPLSWNEDTYFGGYTLMNQNLDPTVIALASYTHALVHRREGFAQGEFGMMGYQNANYWANAANARNVNDVLPLKDIGNRIMNSSKEFGSESIAWCEVNNVVSNFDVTLLHRLMADACRDENMSVEMKEFAQHACEVELKTLIDFCFTEMGYESMLDQNSIEKDEIGVDHIEASAVDIRIDTDLAQAVANKVSSAHIGAFQSSKCVTLRNVMQKRSDNSMNEAITAAAGAACRLLGVASVKLDAAGTSNEVLHIILPWNDKENALDAMKGISSTEAKAFYGGGDLSQGDVFAFIGTKEHNTGSNDCIFSFVPCDPSDGDAIFKDRFFGKRGDTPTSVLQWSKGTIHKKSY